MAECNVLGVTISVLTTSIWDANKGGRVQIIIDNSPKKDIKLLQGFFAEFDPLKSVLAELRRGWMGWDKRQGSQVEADTCQTKQPLILLGRFRDNCNIMFLNFPPYLLPFGRTMVEALLLTLYKVPLKWEEHPPMVTWCESQVRFLEGGPSLEKEQP